MIVQTTKHLDMLRLLQDTTEDVNKNRSNTLIDKYIKIEHAQFYM